MLIRTLGATTVMALSGESAFVGSAAGSDRWWPCSKKLWLSSLWAVPGSDRYRRYRLRHA